MAKSDFKKARHVNAELLAFIRETLPCVACGAFPAVGHHLTTRGAGGGDYPSNLLPLCAKDHTMIHQVGLSKFVKIYPSVLFWLEEAGRDDLLEELT